MTTETTHTGALKAYLNLLKNNGMKRASISQSEHFSRQLLAKLNGHAVNQYSYRVAVDALLSSLPEHYRASAVSAAREFYPFLMSDIKTVATMMTNGDYRGVPDGPDFELDSNIGNFDDLILAAEAATLSPQAFALHAQYLICLTSLGASTQTIDTRGKISKILLYLTRNLTLNGNSTGSEGVSLEFGATGSRLIGGLVAVIALFFVDPVFAQTTTSSGTAGAAQSRITAVATGWQNIVQGVGVAVLIIAWSYVGYMIAFGGKTMKDMFPTMVGTSIAGLAPVLVGWLFS